MTAAEEQSRGGVFVDCRSHWKGRIGQSAVSWSKYQGGAVLVGDDGPDWGTGVGPGLSLAVRLRLVCTCRRDGTDYGQTVLVRQEADPAPKFHFLEEGPVRLGMRVAFDLLDPEGHYHGDGRLDVWVYPEGDIHATWAVQTVDSLAHSRVVSCWLEVRGQEPAPVEFEGRELGSGRTWLRFGRDLPSRFLRLAGQRPWGLYWARDRGYPFAVGSDHGRLPPFYASRWPTAMQQGWSAGNMGWVGGRGAGLEVRQGDEAPTLRFYWRKGGGSGEELTCASTLVLSRAADDGDLQRRVEALQRPLEPQVCGGELRCFTDEDGTYEVGQGDPTLAEVVFPPDPLERQVRIRHYRRKTDPRHRGGVEVRREGARLPVQLMSEGELTDDVCVVMEMAPRRDSVDDVVFAGRLQAGVPTVFRLEKTPGIQAVYQSEIAGLDLQRRAGNRRDLAVWSSHNKWRPLYELDLFSGALHRVSGYGREEEVLWEAPMMWFKSCGISKHDYCNVVNAFEVLQNGPDAVEFYLQGTNPNGRVRAELWLRTPFDHPRLRLEVRMRLEVLERWDHANVEFSDIFPYPSRLVETWTHQAVLFLQGRRSSLVYTLRPDLSVHSGPQAEGEDGRRLFYALFAGPHGNVLTLVENLSAPRHPMHYSVCGNYIDVHVNLQPAEVPAGPGEVFEVRYVCEVHGDENTSVDEIGHIGRRSLEVGDLVVGD